MGSNDEANKYANKYQSVRLFFMVRWFFRNDHERHQSWNLILVIFVCWVFFNRDFFCECSGSQEEQIEKGCSYKRVIPSSATDTEEINNPPDGDFTEEIGMSWNSEESFSYESSFVRLGQILRFRSFQKFILFGLVVPLLLIGHDLSCPNKEP